MSSFRWVYEIEARYDEEEPDSELVRFPSRGWWAAVIMLYGGRLVTIAGPAKMKDGTIVSRQADGSISYLERRKPDA